MAEEPRKKVNFYIVNLIPRPICNVKFQVRQFYQKVQTILEPVAIYCIPKIKPDLEQLQGIIKKIMIVK